MPEETLDEELKRVLDIEGQNPEGVGEIELGKFLELKQQVTALIGRVMADVNAGKPTPKTLAELRSIEAEADTLIEGIKSNQVLPKYSSIEELVEKLKKINLNE